MQTKFNPYSDYRRIRYRPADERRLMIIDGDVERAMDTFIGGHGGELL